MENKELTQLVKHFSLTPFDEEAQDYILTEDEEKLALNHAISQKKEYVRWKMKELAYLESQIEEKIKNIDWDKEIDKAKVLAIANNNKHQDIWHTNNRKKEREAEVSRINELKERCTAEYMFKLMKWTSRNVLGKEFILNEDNKRLITTLCYFFSADQRFETELNFSMKKGLLIRGISGLGKTHLVKCLENNELNPVLILSMIEISEEIKQEGEYQIKVGDKKIIYLDDVGTEEATINHYGTKINFFKNFIEGYYLRNSPFNRLIISTNNSAAEIEEKYGFRVRSRMRDMFNVIDIHGRDMRG
jgi:DNA replication protein DnaC